MSTTESQTRNSLPPRQLALRGVKRRAAHGNLGRFWQDILDRTHAQYAAKGTGKVYPIRNEWAYTDERFWSKQPREILARTLTGGLLMRRKSAPDYVGSIGRYAIQFDAKEFSGASIPYDNFSAKQIEDLYEAFQSGCTLAGFMCLSTRTMGVHWLSAVYAYLWHRDVVTNVAGIKKSINFSQIQDNRVRRLGVVTATTFDYAPTLLAQFQEHDNSNVHPR